MLQVILADDHEIVREGVKRILQTSTEIGQVTEASSLEILVNLPQLRTADVLVLDVSFGDGNAISILKKLREDAPSLKILILSIYPADQYAHACLRLGAHGYLTKECAGDLLVEAVKTVARGEIYGDYAEDLSEQNEDLQEISRVQNRLTSREYEIFLLLGNGLSTNEIARRLDVSAKTVSTHQKNILEKLKIRSKGQLIRFAVEKGFPAAC